MLLSLMCREKFSTVSFPALAFDLMDGQKPEKELGSDQKLAALKKLPSLLELLGNCYFVGGCMIGPQVQ